MSWRRTAAVLGLMVVAAADRGGAGHGLEQHVLEVEHFALGRLNAVHEGDGSNQERGDGRSCGRGLLPTGRIRQTGVSDRPDSGRDRGEQHDPEAHVADSTNTWDFIGPDTLERRPARHAVVHQADPVVGPRHGAGGRPEVQAAGSARLYVGAAGGGLWRIDQRARAEPARGSRSPTASRRTRSARSRSTRTTPPARRSTSAPARRNASGDSEAGLGLYKTTDGGDHWSLVDGSFAVANNRSIAWVAIEQGNANHILIGTRSGVRGISSNATSVATAPAQSPAVGVYNSTDGGATLRAHRGRLVQRGQVRPERLRTPSTPRRPRVGLIRSTTGGAAGAGQTIFSGNRGRYSFSPVRSRTARRASTSPTRAAAARRAARRSTASTTRASRRRR